MNNSVLTLSSKLFADCMNCRLTPVSLGWLDQNAWKLAGSIFETTLAQ